MSEESNHDDAILDAFERGWKAAVKFMAPPVIAAPDADDWKDMGDGKARMYVAQETTESRLSRTEEAVGRLVKGLDETEKKTQAFLDNHVGRIVELERAVMTGEKLRNHETLLPRDSDMMTAGAAPKETMPAQPPGGCTKPEFLSEPDWRPGYYTAGEAKVPAPAGADLSQRHVTGIGKEDAGQGDEA